MYVLMYMTMTSMFRKGSAEHDDCKNIHANEGVGYVMNVSASNRATINFAYSHFFFCETCEKTSMTVMTNRNEHRLKK